jgi:hypothetical protein
MFPKGRFSDQPQYFEKVIRLFIDGQWRFDLVFFLSESFVEQALDGLSQFQDCVAEGVGEPWPTCPQHYHMMLADVVGGQFVWKCPNDPTILRTIGNLI